MNPIQRALLRTNQLAIFALWLAVTLLIDIAADVVNHQSPFSTRLIEPSFAAQVVASGKWLVFLVWAYFAGSFCNSIMPASLRLRPYVFALAAGGLWMNELLRLPSLYSQSQLFMARGFLALLCWGYVARFPAKALVIAETREPALFSHYYRTFLAVVFFPIVIWFLQPRINDLYEMHDWVSVSAKAVPPPAQAPI